MELGKGTNTMFLKTESYIEPIINALNDLIALTENKYAYIYETLPATEEEIRISMREVEILLSHLLYREGAGLENSRASVTIDTVNRIQMEFAEVTESFLSQDLVGILMQTFLNQSGSDDQNFSEMGRLVKEVKDTLADLRDLALNSMIFSIRVGQEGAGFQILSDRINQISTSLGEQFSRMDQGMEGLDNWNQKFQKQLIDFVDHENNLKTNYQERFKEEFQNIREVLQTTCSLLKNHLSNAETVVQRVPETMVLIQNQDIIRQNIENLIKCLQMVQEKKDHPKDGDRDEVLNYIVFVKKVVELSGLLLNNIENGLNESVMALEIVLQEISEQAAELEIETRYLGAFFAGTKEKKKTDFNLMQSLFTTVMNQVADLLNIRGKLESKSDFLLEGRENFYHLMEDMESDFDVINREVRTLKKMRVLIKIELSRINEGNNNSMQNIVGAVDQVLETVTTNQVIFRRLKDYFVKNIDEFNSAVARTKAKIDESSGVLELSKEKLLKIQWLAGGTIEAMSSEMSAIYCRLKQPYVNIQVREQLREMIQTMRDNLDLCSSYVSKEQNRLFDYYGVAQWEEKKEDLKALLDQFTCYVERKSATTVFEDFSAGTDDHSSDIVLF